MNILQDTINTLNDITKTAYDEITTILSLTKNIGAISDDGEDIIYVNLLSASLHDKRLKETAHTRILYDLLKESSYLRRSFIHYFFPDIAIDGYSNIHIPYPDYKRIDLTLKGDGFFIIVENKINGAPEQPKQVKRYYDLAKKEYPSDKIYVLYLNGQTDNAPSDKSLPQDYKELIADRLICKSYKTDVLAWIRQIENTINFELQPYLKSELLQYRIYLEEKYHTLQYNTKMKKQLDKTIIDEFNLDNIPIDEQIEKLKDAIEDTNILAERLKKLLDEREEKRRKTLYQQWFVSLKEEMGTLGITLIKNECNEIGFYFTYKKVEFWCCISDCEDIDTDRNINETKYFWDISSTDEHQYPKIFEEIRDTILNGEKYLQNYEGNPENCAVSNYAPINEIPEIFIYIAKTLINKLNIKI